MKIRILLLTFLFFSCSSIENKKCIKGHYTTSIIPFFNGKTIINITKSNFICDEYEKNLNKNFNI